MRARVALQRSLLALLCSLGSLPAAADAQLADLIERVKPAIVGVGTYAATRSPPAELLGSGFAVGDGSLVATNVHVIERQLDDKRRERLVIFIGRGKQVEYRNVRPLRTDEHHDLALLELEGAALTPLELEAGTALREGDDIAFTGFPIGTVLGLQPVTHQGIVSALTPLALPAGNARQLTAEKIAGLRDPFEIIQLDATAYPGNSGSPLFIRDTGRVVGIINRVFVKGKKEDILRDPSAITYAVPVRYLRQLLEQR